MACLEDFPEAFRKRLWDMPYSSLPDTPLRGGPPLAKRRVAIVTTAAMHRRGDRPFELGEAEYRIIPGETPAGELVLSHASATFDRAGLQQDWNVVFPLDRLRELAAAGEIGSVADYHYAFMGSSDPAAMEPHARTLAKQLRNDRVDAVLLTPV